MGKQLLVNVERQVPIFVVGDVRNHRDKNLHDNRIVADAARPTDLRSKALCSMDLSLPPPVVDFEKGVQRTD